MMLIPCPFCGPRDEAEFHCADESHIARPKPFRDVPEEDWAHYLFYRENPKGIVAERWHHRFGCGLWFNIARDTRTHEITRVYEMTDPRPDPEAS